MPTDVAARACPSGDRVVRYDACVHALWRAVGLTAVAHTSPKNAQTLCQEGAHLGSGRVRRACSHARCACDAECSFSFHDHARNARMHCAELRGSVEVVVKTARGRGMASTALCSLAQRTHTSALPVFLAHLRGSGRGAETNTVRDVSRQRQRIQRFCGMLLARRARLRYGMKACMGPTGQIHAVNGAATRRCPQGRWRRCHVRAPSVKSTALVVLCVKFGLGRGAGAHRRNRFSDAAERTTSASGADEVLGSCGLAWAGGEKLNPHSGAHAAMDARGCGP